MRYLSIVIALVASLAIGSSQSTDISALELLQSPPVEIPPDDCFSRDYTCEATFSFSVNTDGRVSDIDPLELPRSYPCVRSLMRSLNGRVYAEQPTKVRLEERIVGYSCVNGRPANNSFKPTPLRGAA
jgi:hypothetical protein